MEVNTSKVRTDCFAYNKKTKDCDAFMEMFCKEKECKFYKEAYLKRLINKEIKEYSKKMNEIKK